MTAPSQTTMQLMVWTAVGTKLVDRPVDRKTMSLSRHPDADVCIPELLGASVFLRVTENAGTLLVHDEAGQELRVELTPGTCVQLGNLNWLLLAPNHGAGGVNLPNSAPATSATIFGSHANLTVAADARFEIMHRDLMTWVARPMAGIADLKVGLKDFLQLLVDRTNAGSGMLVLAERKGFDLVASVGLSGKDAQRLWEKMPHTLAEEVLRSKARVLLPEELRRTANGDSTVFVRGVQSVAGFTALAEGRLVAIFYLGFDNLLKHLSAELQRALEGAADLLGLVIQRAQLREQLEQLRLKAAAMPDAHFPVNRLMVGTSEKLVEVYQLIARLAPVDVPALILGETGTGKELAAKELHRMSSRCKNPFVVVNAAALPEALIESELFGHKKGAFTGALTDRIGLVEQAHGGTLFIDEIGELPSNVQAKLLRVLQERAVTRIGETQPRAVDFRLVTATHRNLPEMIVGGLFREDLYYRIAGATIPMPSLRDRPEDILALANYFRQQFAQRHGLPDKEWSSEALLALECRGWPGNIRELENVVARAFVMAEGAVIRIRDLGMLEILPAFARGGDSHDSAAADGQINVSGTLLRPGKALEEISLDAARDVWMRGFLSRALQRHNGRRAETAKALGIGERTLFRYIEQLAIGDS